MPEGLTTMSTFLVGLKEQMIAEPPHHPNEFEHSEKYSSFMLHFISYGILGGLMGRIVDHVVAKLQTRYDRWEAVLFITLQIAMNGTAFFFLFKTLTFTRGKLTMTFDDWISSTFQGLIFATTLYSVQTALTNNFQILIKT